MDMQSRFTTYDSYTPDGGFSYHIVDALEASKAHANKLKQQTARSELFCSAKVIKLMIAKQSRGIRLPA